MVFHFWKETVSWTICIPSFSQAPAGHWIKWGICPLCPSASSSAAAGVGWAGSWLCPGSGWWVGACPAFSLRVSFSSWLEWVEKSFQKLSLIHLQNCILHFSRANYIPFLYFRPIWLAHPSLSDGAAFPMLVLQASQLVFLEAQGSDSELAQCFLLLKCCCPLIFFPQAWQTTLPSVEDWCEVSFKAINPANLLEGRFLSTGHCFTFPALLPSEPCMALRWLPCLF